MKGSSATQAASDNHCLHLAVTEPVVAQSVHLATTTQDLLQLGASGAPNDDVRWVPCKHWMGSRQTSSKQVELQDTTASTDYQTLQPQTSVLETANNIR